MLRVRLKADGRLVEVLPGGGEREISPDPRAIVTAAHQAARAANPRVEDASYAKNVRGRTGLTQTAFAARIGVPVETVRNWEQGKRSVVSHFDCGGDKTSEPSITAWRFSINRFRSSACIAVSKSVNLTGS